MKTKRESKRRPPGKRGVKVVYISSPMKVKTSASEFRATVQELTGRDSDVARLMEGANGTKYTERTFNLDISQGEKQSQSQSQSSVSVWGSPGDTFPGDQYISYPPGNESPAEWDSLVGQFDGDLFSMTQVERCFRENGFPLAFQESAFARCA